MSGRRPQTPRMPTAPRSRPPQSRARDLCVALPRRRWTSRTPSFELVGDLLDAGLDAGFVLVAAGSAGNADRADHLLADHDRQRAARGGEAGEILRAHLRIFLQPLFHLARRNAEGARREGLLEAVLHGVRPGAVAADLD